MAHRARSRAAACTVRAACGQNSGDARPAPLRRAPARAGGGARRARARPARAPAGAAAQAARAARAPTRPRVLIAFLPVARRAERRRTPCEPPLAYQPVLGRLDARTPLSLGLSSAAQGSTTAIQALLDITQGTRVSLSTYQPEAPAAAGVPAGDGTAARGSAAGSAVVHARGRRARRSCGRGCWPRSVPGGAGYAGVARALAARRRSSRPTAPAASPRSRSAPRATSPSARRRCSRAARSSSPACRRARPGDAALDRLIALRRARRAADRHADAAGRHRRRSCCRSATLGLGGTPAGG